MDEQQLRHTVHRAQAGEADAYEALLNAYSKRLYGYFIRSTGRHHDAEDLLSEMMLKLVRTLKNYDHRGRFEPWLFRIAANMVRDRIRRRTTRPRAMSLSAADDGGGSMGSSLPAEGPQVDAAMMAAEASGDLQSALAKLDEQTRQMILLRHFGEMSFKDIAAAFDCPLGTALAKVHRGIKQLRRLMVEP
ncbi:MAG: sigma-70 family RNA polymerase sigma factor [Planctomycetes bacterium]|jgi:RNA polymerase sigma-70 factor (ECF subfamily)|nr:sigma-70 family RNA polymerase sigma factor [Phycisphaerae bacterium]NBB96430.1 sigma-70 family RNA polymerase sigma factor [Planctomycetota bacterium]